MIYVEEEILNHPRTLQIQSRFPDAEVVPCARYGEIFNRRAQHFRLQKRRPSLILAKKHRNFVHDAPEGFGLAGARSFLFDPLLNCIYDCRYCYLQGMFRSAHYVVFVNYEDFQWAIEEKIRALPDQALWFFSGYDCDSLALEPVTRLAASFVPFFARFPQANLELRTKSTQIKSLIDMEAVPNVVVAFSFTPEEVQASLEHETPSVDRRIRAMERLQERGWRLGHYDFRRNRTLHPQRRLAPRWLRRRRLHRPLRRHLERLPAGGRNLRPHPVRSSRAHCTRSQGGPPDDGTPHRRPGGDRRAEPLDPLRPWLRRCRNGPCLTAPADTGFPIVG